VPIQRLLKEAVFDPVEISRLVAAYERTLQLLRPKDRTDAVKELVAKKIIEVARAGESDTPRSSRGGQRLPHANPRHLNPETDVLHDDCKRRCRETGRGAFAWRAV
jgi:hypothetical protein